MRYLYFVDPWKAAELLLTEGVAVRLLCVSKNHVC